MSVTMAKEEDGVVSYKQNEITSGVMQGKGSETNLRYRNRSDESMGNGSLCSTPDSSTASLSFIDVSSGGGSEAPKKKRRGHLSPETPDSGFGAVGNDSLSCSPVYPPPRMTSTVFSHCSSFREDDEDGIEDRGNEAVVEEPVAAVITSPLEFIRRMLEAYQSRPAVLSSPSSGHSSLVKPHQLLPVVVVLVILASSIFTLLFLKSAVGRRFTEGGEMLASNGKYASMEYAVLHRYKRLAEEGKVLPHDLRDEGGEVLSGKRAAMQFAYELKRLQDGKQQPGPEDPEVEELLNDVFNSEGEFDEGKKRILLQKIEGILATSLQKDSGKNDDDDVPDFEDEEDESEMQQTERKREVPRRSKPFRKFQADKEGEMNRDQSGFVKNNEDPFRFRFV